MFTFAWNKYASSPEVELVKKHLMRQFRNRRAIRDNNSRGTEWMLSPVILLLYYILHRQTNVNFHASRNMDTLAIYGAATLAGILLEVS
ncbi:MAG: hypothetical protein ABIR49_03955 [Nitrosospira sp.]